MITGTSATEWLTAIGTVSAVAVALGLQLALWLRAYLRRPRLTLAFDVHARQEETNVLTGEGVPYQRIAVSNKSKSDTARNVQLLVLAIEPLEVGGQITAGGRAVWLANPALGWANAFYPPTAKDLPPVGKTTMDLPPGATRYVDLGRWMRLNLPGLRFVLSVVPEPAQSRHLLEPGRWEITLSAVLDNAESTTWRVEILFSENFAQQNSAALALADSRCAIAESA